MIIRRMFTLFVLIYFDEKESLSLSLFPFTNDCISSQELFKCLLYIVYI